MDGAAGWPLPGHGGKTSLEVARTPNLDRMAVQGLVGKVRTVPDGMEPSSACACLSILGYDPRVSYKGRGGIEARSMGLPLADGDVVFRCNLVAIREGKMWSYSAGQITSEEARPLIDALQERLGDKRTHFHAGVSYRHLCILNGRQETLQAVCTPPHDIPNQPVAQYLPQGPGSEVLLDLMSRSEAVLKDHPVNKERVRRGDAMATSIWLFWGSNRAPDLPDFRKTYGVKGAMTSGVDLLRGIAGLAGLTNLTISGVTDGMNNDYAAQAEGALAALDRHELVIIHIEAPDEAGHSGSVEEKVKALESIDREVVGRLGKWRTGDLRVLVMPDHPTPIKIQTHVAEPVPFLLWGPGFPANGAKGFSEAEAEKSGLFVAEGHSLMKRLLSQDLERPE